MSAEHMAPVSAGQCAVHAPAARAPGDTSPPITPSGSRENPFDHLRRLNAGQTLIQALRLERELRMVNPETMQQGRVEIMQADRIADDVVREVVRLAIHQS